MAEQEIVRLRAEGKSWREIGSAVGMTHEGARKAYRRATAVGTYDPVVYTCDDPDIATALAAINRAGERNPDLSVGELTALQTAVDRLARRYRFLLRKESLR